MFSNQLKKINLFSIFVFVSKNSISKEKGFAAFFITVMVSSIILSISASIFLLNYGEQAIALNVIKSKQAYYAAEAGIEDSVYRIKNSMNVSSNYTISVGTASANILIDTPNQNTKIITANGNKDNTFQKLEIIMSIESINPQFFYGAQAGVLGIVMENNSRIEGAGGQAGNVYSNGSVEGDSGATITGNIFVATGISEDQVHTVYNSSQTFGKEDPIIDIAQSFKPSITNTLTRTSVYIKKVGNPDSKTIRILTDASGSPSKTVLASATLQKNLVGTSFGWVDIVFSSPPTLTQGATYWLMVDASKDNNDYWVWGKDQNQGYGNGQAKYALNWSASSPVWTTIPGDLNFKTYMGGQITFLEDVVVLGDAHANTILNSRICGDGYYQTIDSSSFNYLNNPSKSDCPEPLTSGAAFPNSADPPLQNMPVSESNINQWKDDATNGGTYAGNFFVNSNLSIGPQKIDGNLVMTSNNKTLTITGVVYVTGYLDISNGSSIKCSGDYGLKSCVMVVDQWVHVTNNGVFQGSGQAGSYMMILSNSSCDGSFSAGCTHHNAAMDLHNNASGAIFYANEGLIYLHNGVEVTEITAKKIYLNQGAIIRYEQGIINANFSSGPGGSWQIKSWKEIE